MAGERAAIREGGDFMTPVLYQIAMMGGEDAYVRGYVFGGFGIRKPPYGNGYWLVDHLKTGRLVAQFNRYLVARRFCRDANRLVAVGKVRLDPGNRHWRALRSLLVEALAIDGGSKLMGISPDAILAYRDSFPPDLADRARK